MRLFVALPDKSQAEEIRNEMELRQWSVSCSQSGRQTTERLCEETFDLLLLHRCLGEMDGFAVGEGLKQSRLICPPRIVLLSPREYCPERPDWADAVVESGVSVHRLCSLLLFIAKKPLPQLAAAKFPQIKLAVESFLDQIAMDSRCKGYTYAAWILMRILPSTIAETLPLNALYASCADAFGVRPASVERCLRTAVESVFTQGSIQGIERFFGATVDPEKGKPTNRAFLLQAAGELRRCYSLADARSPNSSVMHHSPAAPTSV